MKPQRLILVLVALCAPCMRATSMDANSDRVRSHQLLIFTIDSPIAQFSALNIQQILNGYVVEPLLPELKSSALLQGVSGSWKVATPVYENLLSSSPWDAAYDAAAKLRVAATSRGLVGGKFIYVEPNIEHFQPFTKRIANPAGDKAMPPDWPNGKGFAWHLRDDYSGLASARKNARVDGCSPRITILDTGIYPPHHSTPRHVNARLERNFFDPERTGNIHDATDPGTSDALIKNPTHGTGTVAILAGGKVFASESHGGYVGDLGGIPDAEIVPVRIADSVVHFWTKEMAAGIFYATTLPDAGNGKYCDVISISAGGLPTRIWADAVNSAYENGIVIVAASGDNFEDLPTRFAVYPSRFSRVIMATGVMANFSPYVAPRRNWGELQGSYGPNSVMKNAVAAYTPNIPWARWGKGNEGIYDLDGGGTSAATPQIAAAFALWLQSHAIQDRLKPGPDWIEASKQAIFHSADKSRKNNFLYFGNGLLRANAALGVTAEAPFDYQSPAVVDFPFWRILVGLPEPSSISGEDQMLQVEALQTAVRFKELAPYTSIEKATISKADKKKFIRKMLNADGISNKLREFLTKHS